MKSPKGEKITDELIGMDEKICKCSSIVADIIIVSDKEKEEKTSLSSIVDSIKKGQKKADSAD